MKVGWARKSGRHQLILLASLTEVSTMEKLPRQVYPREFREQAVELVTCRALAAGGGGERQRES
jgi:hypothetical protein